MGFIFSKSMNENMKNQQEFMLMNARLQTERKGEEETQREKHQCEKDIY
uniref:Uncharacterized protein n=1 Tax=Myotis myotis TaxID=51298 RepID=A0A7J7UQ38_MYOMY|nr:hypothetical protein mMyoMyo1_008641 [Myotis myotis]